MGHAEANRRMGEASFAAYLPRLIVYPLYGHALGIVLTFSGLLTLASAAGLFTFGLPLTLITLGFTYGYAVHVVRRTAMGEALPPPLEGTWVNPFEAKQSILWLYLGAVAALAASFGYTISALAAWIVLGAGLALLPACALVLAMDGGLVQAMNPLALIVNAWRMGPSYPVTAVAFALPFLLHSRLEWLPVWPRQALGIYLLVAAAHLTGYVAFRRRERLGLAVEHAPELDAERERAAFDREVERVLERLHRLAESGQSAKALAELDAAALSPPDPVTFQSFLLERFASWSRPRLALAYGRRLVAADLTEGRDKRLARVLDTCLDRDPDFLSDDPALRDRCRQRMSELGRDDLARRL